MVDQIKKTYFVQYPHGGSCRTDWLPMAEAAWNRASKDTLGGYSPFSLSVDGREVARSTSRPEGSPWPRQYPAVTLANLYKATALLAHQLDIDRIEIAETMSKMGLTMSPANIKEAERGKGGSMAELVVEIHALITIIKEAQQ